jgi:hypothetical protein
LRRAVHVRREQKAVEHLRYSLNVYDAGDNLIEGLCEKARFPRRSA